MASQTMPGLRIEIGCFATLGIVGICLKTNDTEKGQIRFGLL